MEMELIRADFISIVTVLVAIGISFVADRFQKAALAKKEKKNREEVLSESGESSENKIEFSSSEKLIENFFQGIFVPDKDDSKTDFVCSTIHGDKEKDELTDIDLPLVSILEQEEENKSLDEKPPSFEQGEQNKSDNVDFQSLSPLKESKEEISANYALLSNSIESNSNLSLQTLSNRLRSTEELRQAILLSTILGSPKGILSYKDQDSLRY